MSLQVAALYQLGSLTSRLGTVTTSLLTDSSLKLLDTVFSGLLSPWLPVRLASSQCLRHVSSAVPRVATLLLNHLHPEDHADIRQEVSGKTDVFLNRLRSKQYP